MKPTTVLLGYELGTGRDVRIPVQHMAVTGITQQSGKTTTLEALIGRSGLRAVTFVTKRAEGAFADAARIPAYFREHADWLFVSSLLEAFLQEKKKFERSWIMRVCQNAKSLRDVQKNIDAAMHGARAGLDESVYFTLQQYFEALIPEIERLPYSKELKLKPGINVIDVSEYSTHLQGLVVRSVMEWIYERERDVITIIPESWEFVPQKHGSPAKSAAVQLIRKGAAAGNFVWLDSQDLAGVDKEIIKQVSVYILGVQREKNEVKNTLMHIPGAAKKLKPEQIMNLSRGWFYAVYGPETRCTYVQPAWLDAEPERARRYATEDLPASYVAPRATKKRLVPAGATPAVPANAGTGNAAADRFSSEAGNHTEKTMPTVLEYIRREFPEYQHIQMLELPEVVITLLGQLKYRLTMHPSAHEIIAPAVIDYIELANTVLDLLRKTPEFNALQIKAEKPEITVNVRRKLIELDGGTLKGRLARMIAEGWFDEAKTGNAAYNELVRLGFPTAKLNVYRELDKLAELEFLTKETTGGFLVVAGMKINIRESAA